MTSNSPHQTQPHTPAFHRYFQFYYFRTTKVVGSCCKARVSLTFINGIPHTFIMHDFDEMKRENKGKERRGTDTMRGEEWRNCLSLEPNGIVLYARRKMSRSPRLFCLIQSHHSSANNDDDDKFIHEGAQ